ncbi:PPOX class F420-dependent enzyme [Haloglomus irregulare]|jgi:PPOX class probable F420-dependent enzyme|uniref:PPOX class F420-dependent enzyme n=1 Tax=Haloglomus irregulare TaxID=2234134 RepID=A0A554MZ15_9EURY|nr:PPOX class F420-dependent oxidoreductase [Haloglomus irregulare]TSD10010.1 PPOX class F420-dependent enzyme [Haloglomus irregulare]
MTSIPDDYHDLFEKPTIAHLSTLLPDGAPHSAPVWIDYDTDADRLLVNTERESRKEKNVRGDRRVAVSMTDPDDPYRMLSVRGAVAAVTTDGAREHIDELTQRYMGESEYPSPIRTERVILSITVEHATGMGE